MTNLKVLQNKDKMFNSFHTFYQHHNDKASLRMMYCLTFDKCERTFFRKMEAKNFTKLELYFLISLKNNKQEYLWLKN